MEGIERHSAVLTGIGGADLRAPARAVSLALALGLLLYLALTWDGYGLGPQEGQRQMYGRLLLDFYRSGFSDGALLQRPEMAQGGGLFDLLAALLELVWPGTVWDLRHLLSGVFGLAGVLAAWKLARLLAGETAAMAAALILTLSGAWSGAMFTHSAEIPLAACMAWGLYFVTCLVRGLPAIDRAGVLRFGFAAGAALAMGDGAWLLPLCLALTLAVAARQQGPKALPRLAGWARQLLPAVLAALPLLLLARPLLLVDIFSAPAAAVQVVVPTAMDGAVMLNQEVPRSYLHEYLLVKLPELMLIGLALALGGRPWHSEAAERCTERRATARRGRPLHLPLVLAIALPIGYAWCFRPALADGLRQFLYLLPPMAVAAALGWRMLWQAVRGSELAAWSLAVVASLLVFAHATTLVHLHPYGHTYYNSLLGGLRGAFGGWVMDYDAASLRESAEFLNDWLAREQRREPAGARAAPIPVAVCAEPLQARAWLSPRFEITRDVRRARFVIASSHLDCLDDLPGTRLHLVVRQGVPLAQVIDRRGAGTARRPG